MDSPQDKNKTSRGNLIFNAFMQITEVEEASAVVTDEHNECKLLYTDLKACYDLTTREI